jgi:phage baseplate assembly protein W
MNIKIRSLETDKISEKSLSKGFLYKDVEFDLVPRKSFNFQLNKTEYLKDVQPLYDLESVKNSLRTAFLTAPGEKILNPTYGVDLRQFLFEPVDDFTSDIIEDLIKDRLPLSEPRILVRDVKVVGDEDEQSYKISMIIDVPSLDITGVSLKSELNSIGYSIL